MWVKLVGQMQNGNENIQMVFFSNRLIITIGWAIYPMGYFIEHLGGGIDQQC